jgi:hypothetical protein
MFNNNYEKYPFYEYNYELYPNEEQQLNFITSYVEEMNKETQDLNNNDKDNINQNSINEITKEANMFALASHLSWSHWSICQIEGSQMAEFDFMVSIV